MPTANWPPRKCAGCWERTRNLRRSTPLPNPTRRWPELARQFPGLHLPRTATLFEALTIAILGQQISASVARTMRTLLIERYGARCVTPAEAGFDGVTYFAFPRPEAILSARLKSCGSSSCPAARPSTSASSRGGPGAGLG